LRVDAVQLPHSARQVRQSGLQQQVEVVAHSRSWYIPRWLDRVLPNATIEPPHDEAAPRLGAERPAEALGRP
jgi:hypothetical protein